MRVRKRFRRIKRLVYLGGIAGTVFALRQAKARRDAHINLGPPATWPPLEPSEPPVAAVGDLVTAADTSGRDETPATGEQPVASDEPVAALGDIAADTTTTEDEETAVGDVAAPSSAGWVEPEENGSCPVSHPIKANANSGIYHEPGGQFYERTRAERCYEDTAAAQADGYRAARGS